MENEEFYDDEFIITLTIGGTTYDELEVNVTDPSKTLRDQINSIVQVFELPKMDGATFIQYLLARGDDDELEILDFEDEDGREQCLLDYKVQPGDHLLLISIPVAGCGSLRVSIDFEAPVTLCPGVVSVRECTIWGHRLLWKDGDSMITYLMHLFHLPLFWYGHKISYLLYTSVDGNTVECEKGKRLADYITGCDAHGVYSPAFRLIGEKSSQKYHFRPVLERWLRKIKNRLLYQDKTITYI